VRQRRRGGGGVSSLTCREFVEMVTAFLDSALDQEAVGRFVAHIPACDGCGRYLEHVRQTIRALGDLPARPLPAETHDALVAALRASPS
jgi:anti-sigma factor RsiW